MPDLSVAALLIGILVVLALLLFFFAGLARAAAKPWPEPPGADTEPPRDA